MKHLKIGSSNELENLKVSHKVSSLNEVKTHYNKVISKKKYLYN